MPRIPKENNLPEEFDLINDGIEGIDYPSYDEHYGQVSEDTYDTTVNIPF